MDRRLFQDSPACAHRLFLEPGTTLLAACLPTNSSILPYDARLAGLVREACVPLALGARAEHLGRYLLHAQPPEESTAEPPIQSVCRLLLDDPATPWPLKRLAALAGYSPWHFLRRFRRETGLTPHAFYLLCRLRLARPVAGRYGSGRGRRIRRFYGPEPSAQAVQATARHDVGAVPAGKPQAGSVMNLANNQRPFSPARTSCGVLAGRIAMLPGR